MNKRWLWILLGGVVLCTLLVAGAAAGAGLTYLALRARPVEAASNLVLQSINLNTDDYEAGVVVTHVEPDSPAADAGITRGDIILSVDDQKVDTMLDLMREIEGKSAGEEIILTVQHCETTKEVNIKLEEQNGHIYLGLHMSRSPLMGIMPHERGFYVSPVDTHAFIITGITPGSPADDAGLEIGAMIAGINGEQFQAEDDLAEIIQSYQSGDEIILDIARPSLEQSEQVSITLGEHPDDPDLPYLGISYVTAPGFNSENFRRRVFPESGFPHLEGEILPLPDMIPGFKPKWHEFPPLPEGVEQAVVVSSVSKAGPADQAGLEAGDLITAVNGEFVADPETFIEIIHSYDQGDEITLSVYRSGEADEFEIDVVLGGHPDIEGQAYLGVTISGFLRIEDSHPFQEFDAPFHFEFQFPWPDGEFQEHQNHPDLGDEA